MAMPDSDVGELIVHRGRPPSVLAEHRAGVAVTVGDEAA